MRSSGQGRMWCSGCLESPVSRKLSRVIYHPQLPLAKAGKLIVMNTAELHYIH